MSRIDRTRIKNAASSTFTGLGAVLVALAEIEVEAQRPAIETPTQQRIALATAVAGMDYQQLHPIARAISDRRSAYGVSYRECGYVPMYAFELDEAEYRRGVVAAISNCPDAMLVQLAVMIAGSK